MMMMMMCVCVCVWVGYNKLLFHGECNMDISSLRSWVNNVIILCQGRCTCVIFADMMTHRGVMAFNGDNTNNLMRGIECLFDFTACAAGYSNLILGQY
jgi:hypothetical protein